MIMRYRKCINNKIYNNDVFVNILQQTTFIVVSSCSQLELDIAILFWRRHTYIAVLDYCAIIKQVYLECLSLYLCKYTYVSITNIWGLFDLSLAQLIKYLYLRIPRGINICICNILEDNLLNVRNQGLNIYPIRHSVSAFHWTILVSLREGCRGKKVPGTELSCVWLNCSYLHRFW